MIQEEINKDIRKYKEKFLGPLSARETACIGLGTGFSYLVKTYAFPDISWTSDAMAYLTLLCMAPFVAFGWIRVYGLYLEDFCRSAMKTVLAPKKRTYSNDFGKKKKNIRTKRSKNAELKRFA